MRALTPLLLLLASLASSVLPAQDAPANAVGTVFDSVRLRPLTGARVRVDSSPLFAVTDGDGKFSLQGIPPGEHELVIEHPLLDTLGINLRSPRQTFLPGSTTAHQFGTPSPERFVTMVCAPAWRARGPGLLVGRVREADSGRPAVGAKVSLVWYEVTTTSGVRRVPRVREATVGSDGVYRICGLPPGLDGKIQVLRGPLTSGEVPVEFGTDLLAARSLSIAAPGALVVAAPVDDSAGARTPAPVILGTARLTGRVVNRAGVPLGGARVQLEGTTRATATRASGEFTLDSLPPGTQSLAVRLLGYLPVEVPVELSSREPRTVQVTLDAFVPTLEAVRVTAARDRALDDIGFTRRKRTGMGHYMDGEQLSSRNAQHFSDLVRTFPGVRISSQGGRQMITSARDPMGGCVLIYVDGTMWQQMEPGDIDDFVKPYEVGALEVYSPNMAPAEYQGPNGSSCLTIVAWTHRKLDRRR